MQKQHLIAASRELFTRPADEVYPDFDTLYADCQQSKEASRDHWQRPHQTRPVTQFGKLAIEIDVDDPFAVVDDGKVYGLNDWSFTQLCRMAGVAKDTINRLNPHTACMALCETLPQGGAGVGGKPMQFHVQQDVVRSCHTAAYSRLYDVELLSLVKEYATDFGPPPKGMNGHTGLYRGQQDLFVFLVDPLGWCDIEGETFTPGLFLWNSEVGARSVGIQTFWLQKVCANHIVWDATEVVSFTRKHTGDVHDAFGEIRRIIERLVDKRDERRDRFAGVMATAFKQQLGKDADDVAKVLSRYGIPTDLRKRVLQEAEDRQSGFTVFSVVDALTRYAREQKHIGNRTDLDAKASRLLELAES